MKCRKLKPTPNSWIRKFNRAKVIIKELKEVKYLIKVYNSVGD